MKYAKKLHFYQKYQEIDLTINRYYCIIKMFMNLSFVMRQNLYL